MTPGGFVYHVLNRTVAGLPLFRKQTGYEAFERIRVEAQERHPLRILAWCLLHTLRREGRPKAVAPKD